jgi:mRNA interferase RelE/StbE
MYEVILQKPAEKFLKKLDKENQKRVISKLKELENNPHIGIPLVGNLTGLWKLRIGDYRAVYQIDDDKLIVLVLKIGHRKNVYD